MQMCDPHDYFLVAVEKATMVTSGGKALFLFWFYGFVCRLEKPAVIRLMVFVGPRQYSPYVLK